VRARDVQIMVMPPTARVRRRWFTRARSADHSGQAGAAPPVLEDAAGVAGLHARRHEAELRLKAAETNLTRVETWSANWPDRSTV